MREGLFGFVFALIFVALALYAIKTGEVRLRGGIRVERATYALAFWLLVAAYFGLALLVGWMGMRAI